MSNLLIKKTNLEVEKVFPKTYIHNITDKSSNKTLALILNSFNMYFLSYTGNVSTTRCLVPMTLRKKGLWITYVKYDGNVCTEWYAASDIDDESWGDSSNWRIGNNMLVGDITISANGNWIINGTETEFKAIGEKGNTPLIRIANNRLLVSYDSGDTYKNVTENPVYTQFKFNSLTNTYQVSYDLGSTWLDVSDEKVYYKFRYNGETNTHLVSTDFGTTWTNVSEDKVFYLFRTNDNRLLVSTDLGTTWEDCSEPIAAWFRWADVSGTGNVGKVLISRDNNTWEDLSPTMTNNLYIKGYVLTIGNLPSNAAIGDIYMVGPTYDESDTTHDYPHYRMWVKLSSGWVDNGEYLSNVLISLITGLETGITMSLKAITNAIAAEQERAEAAEEAAVTKNEEQDKKLSELGDELNSVNKEVFSSIKPHLRIEVDNTFLDVNGVKRNNEDFFLSQIFVLHKYDVVRIKTTSIKFTLLAEYNADTDTYTRIRYAETSGKWYEYVVSYDTASFVFGVSKKDYECEIIYASQSLVKTTEQQFTDEQKRQVIANLGLDKDIDDVRKVSINNALEISEVKEDVKILTDANSEESTIISFDNRIGIINNNGIFEERGTRHASYKIFIEDFYKLSITASSGYTNGLFAIYDENDAVLEYKNATSAESYSIQDFEVAIPKGAKYLIVSNWTDNAKVIGYYKKNSLFDKIVDNDNAINDITNFEWKAKQVEFISGKILKNNGTITDNASQERYVSEPIDVSKEKEISITASSGYSNNLYAFYNTENECVLISSASNSELDIVNRIIRVPSNASYLRISKWGEHDESCKVKSWAIKGQEEQDNDFYRLSANLVNPDNQLVSTAINTSGSGMYSTYENSSYHSYLNILLKAGVTYVIMPTRLYVVMDITNTTRLKNDTTERSQPTEYTPSVDCYLSITYYASRRFYPFVCDKSLSDRYEKYGIIIKKPIINPLYHKTIYNFGDSIMAGDGAIDYKGFAEITAENEGMYCTDYAIGGATITNCKDKNRSWILEQIQNASSIEPDFIVFDGGINDTDWREVGNAPAYPTSHEAYEEAYINSLDTTKIAGAFETTIYTLINKYPTSQIVCCFMQKMWYHFNDGTQAMHDVEKAICEKWGVVFLDFWDKGGINLGVKKHIQLYGSTSTDARTIEIDGVLYDATHPNKLGYEKFFVPKLKAKLLEIVKTTQSYSDIKGIVRGTSLQPSITTTKKISSIGSSGFDVQSGGQYRLTESQKQTYNVTSDLTVTKVVQTLLGYDTANICAFAGNTASQIFFKLGLAGYIIKNEITLPKDKTAVNYPWSLDNFSAQMTSTLSSEWKSLFGTFDGVINGVNVKVYSSTNQSVGTITLIDDLDADVVIPAGSILYMNPWIYDDAGANIEHGTIQNSDGLLLQIGANSEGATPQEIIEYFELAIKVSKCKWFVALRQNRDGSSDLNNAIDLLRKKYGSRFIDHMAYLKTIKALQDQGITPTTSEQYPDKNGDNSNPLTSTQIANNVPCDMECIANGNVPSSFWHSAYRDGEVQAINSSHFNAQGIECMGKFIVKMIRLLEIVE